MAITFSTSTIFSLCVVLTALAVTQATNCLFDTRQNASLVTSEDYGLKLFSSSLEPQNCYYGQLELHNQTNGITQANGEQAELLVIAQAALWEAWYHYLFDQGLTALKALHDSSYWDAPKEKRAVLFVPAVDHTSRRLPHAMHELMSMFFGQVWESPSHMQSHLEQSGQPLFFKEVVLAEERAPVTPRMIEEEWVPVVKKVQEEIARVWASNTADTSHKDSISEQCVQNIAKVAVNNQLEPLATVVDRVGTKRTLIHGVGPLEAVFEKQEIPYQTVTFSRPLLHQWASMYCSSIVVGVHGSDTANILWMRPGAAVIEIFPENWNTAMYMWWAKALGLRYFSVNGTHVQQKLVELENCPENLTEETCKFGTRPYYKDCCQRYWRDRQVDVDVQAVQQVVTKAADPTYKPECYFHWGDMKHNAEAFHCS